MLEVSLGRVINFEGAGKERTLLTRSIVLALRELIQQTEPNDLTRDLAAFISLALKAIHQTIDESVAAWEKRGYWLKSDRFRLEWAWSENLSQKMGKAVLAEDWSSVTVIAVEVAHKLNHVRLPTRHRLGEPWRGAWGKLQARRVFEHDQSKSP